jgi:hypothetical protein
MSKRNNSKPANSLRDNSVVQANIRDIAQQRYFYDIPQKLFRMTYSGQWTRAV